MRFEETDEQQMIREMVRDFAESVLPPTIEHRDANQIPPAEEWEQFITSPPYIQNFGVAAGIVAANMSNDENNLVNFSCCMEVFIYANAPEDTTEGFVGLNQICFESVCGVAVSDFCKCN